MELKIAKIFHELEISNIDSDERTIRVLDGDKRRTYDKNKRYLNIYSSLMSSPEGKFSGSLTTDEASVHRFDWHFGVSLPSAKDAVFDWVGTLREDRSICIQVLIETPGPKCECVVANADINGFKPLNTMKDESTNYLSLAGSIISGASPFPFLSKAMGMLTSEADRKDAARYENRFKNMFRLFRFLTEKGDQGLEYVLTKDVLGQWGTFLRGSFGLCFFSESPEAAKTYEYRIKLIPRLGFKKDDHLCFLPPPEQQDEMTIEIAVSVHPDN